jgi:phosphonate transport system permease protein
VASSLASGVPAFAEPSSNRLTKWRLVLGVLALLLWAGWNSKIDLRLLCSAQTWRAVADLLVRLFPPDFSSGSLRIALNATLATAATAVVATVIASIVALPLGVFASGRLWRTGVASGTGPGGMLMSTVSWAVLHGMGFIRSIPDLVWALLFVAGVGLGRLAGTLALMVSYTALLGRVYADIFDEADRRPLEALQALGATRLQMLLFGILPQSRTLLISYTLYSFECAVRSAAVLGFVGGGGLGYEINLSMRLFEFRQVLTLLICFILLLLMVDILSRMLRAPLEATPELSPGLTMRNVFGKHRRNRWLAMVLLPLALLCSLPAAGFLHSELLQSDTLNNLAHFVRALLTPSVSPAFLREVVLLSLQTISISLLGTASGTAFGFLLAFPATRLRSDRHESLVRTFGTQVRTELVFWSARMVLNLLRSIPELVWVLVCVIAVGFGPFAGSIALGLHTGGVLGKLFAESMEESPQQQVEAMLALGASRMQCLCWALLPQSWPVMRRYILLRWDMNLRAATILGLVGGGGLGQAIYNDVQLADYSKVSTLVLAIAVLVIGCDWLSRTSIRMTPQT